MPIKIDLVQRKLLALDQAVARLRVWSGFSAEQLDEDLQRRWAVERGLHIAAEALFDVGNHILSGQFREVVDRYADVLPRLAACGVVQASTASALRGLAGFRNILVHEYAEIDLAKVSEALSRLEDFDAFSADVTTWLHREHRT